MAWYKANYPHEFYEALLNGYMDKPWEIDRILLDAAAHNVFVITPDKTESGLFEVVR
jgi:DNA polymerase III alpha subunit